MENQVVKWSCLVALILVKSQSRELLHKKQMKVFPFFPHLFFTPCTSMKAIRIFKVLHKLHFWLRFCSGRPGSEPGYLRNILHIRYRSSLLFHHRECPRAFYLSFYQGFILVPSEATRDLAVSQCHWNPEISKVFQFLKDMKISTVLRFCSLQKALSTWILQKVKTHQTKHTDI